LNYFVTSSNAIAIDRNAILLKMERLYKIQKVHQIVHRFQGSTNIETREESLPVVLELLKEVLGKFEVRKILQNCQNSVYLSFRNQGA
jgi:hypothetical protein